MSYDVTNACAALTTRSDARGGCTVSAELPADGGGAEGAQDHPLQRLRGAHERRGVRPSRRQAVDATHAARQGTAAAAPVVFTTFCTP